MKKLLLVLVLPIIFIISACSMDLNTPTKRVEEFFSKYQKLDSEILSRLDSIIASDNIMTDSEKKEYSNLMKKQYQNMSYKITDEEINDDTSKVYVEVEVYDYKSTIDNVDNYFQNHKEEFIGENNKIDEEKYNDYKIQEMKKVNDRVKYDMVFTLKKINNSVWVLDDITDDDIEKLHGLYKI